MRRRIKTRTPEERAYKNALLIGGNFSELDTEINFRNAERKKNNFHDSKVNNHCQTKPKKRKNMMRKERAERSFEYALNQIKSLENLENREKRNRSRRGR